MHGDGNDLQLSVQAVHSWGPKKGIMVILHVENATTGMESFGDWLKGVKVRKLVGALVCPLFHQNLKRIYYKDKEWSRRREGL